MAKRKGSLSKEELAKIEQMRDSMSIQQMATELNRTPRAIQKVLDGLSTRLISVAPDLDEEAADRKRIMRDLRAKGFYIGLKSMFTTTELTYFCERWVDLVLQFSDEVEASEEGELRDLITLDILTQRLLIENKRLQEQSRPIQLEIDHEYQLSKQERDQGQINKLRAIIAGNQQKIEINLKLFKELSDRAEKTRRALNASREQRTKDLSQSRINFPYFLKMLQDYHSRKATGREMELMKMAKDKGLENLQEPLKYASGEVDMPILNSDSVKKHIIEE